MKKSIITTLILLLTIIGVMGAESATVVPGRTWWYGCVVATTSWEPGVEMKYDRVVIGLTLDSEVGATKEGWTDCHAVDCSGTDLYNKPVAQVKEENGQVWMIPNMRLRKLAKTKADTEARSLFELFLGFGNGNKYDMDGPGVAWTKESDNTPYLIYDFNLGVGGWYEWPWAGRYVDSKTNEYGYFESGIREPGFYVTSVSENEVNDQSAKEYKVYSIGKDGNLEHLESHWWYGVIREGIGIVEGEWFSLWSGFWICPASFDIPRYTGFQTLEQPSIPYLVSVQDADGTCVYGNAEFDPASVSAPSGGKKADDAIYDLQGRKVTNPAPGLYVRGGKKILVR